MIVRKSAGSHSLASSICWMIKGILKYLNEVYGREKRYGFKEAEKAVVQETDRYV